MADKDKKKKKRVSARKKKALQEQQSIEKRAAISTGVIFLALFISFMFIALRSPVPEPQQKGIDVVLGEHNLGKNEQFKEIKEPTDKEGQAEEAKTQEAEKAEETQSSQTQESQIEEPSEQTSETQDDVPAPKMSDKEKEKEKQKEEPEKEGKEQGEKAEDEKNQQKEEREVEEKNLFTPSENKGDKGESGNQGDEEGKKDAESFEKKGEAAEGDSPISDLNLGDRGVTEFPKIKEETQQQGKVVVEITVNKNGEVVKAVPGKRGTTISSLRLKNIAKQAALDTKFEKVEDGPNRQVGTMTINFKVQ